MQNWHTFTPWNGHFWLVTLANLDKLSRNQSRKWTRRGEKILRGEFIRNYRKFTNLSQQEFADKIHMDRTVLSKIESGNRRLPESHDSVFSSLNWRFAIAIADERTGGFISNILEDVPNLDLHPAALKDLLLRELHEACSALEGLVTAKHIDPEKRREGAERVWYEISDVIDKAMVMKGVLEEEFGLNRKSLMQKHQLEVKRGER
ncbi:helix-turn-helix domain-containing protein [Paenibacillus sp. SI8]|uniref:helix-turn-helix domain-containing protein n=1 Tax=unclassified Paenibacillus TaxID=185978 RepID=UPI003466E9B4